MVAAQPHGAPTWFPCNDRPDDKATYRIAVAAPAGYVVVSNGESRRAPAPGQRGEPGTTAWTGRWRRTSPRCRSAATPPRSTVRRSRPSRPPTPTSTGPSTSRPR
ncbi:hypothetical protein [Nocardioides convexus]|uniref:hypothetical protein n=1 Tax=Nocardioides convexus TaxID=2712224 RepID=UPI0024189080|nr:hypothetical protein [Nocardioides convexus]